MRQQARQPLPWDTSLVGGPSGTLTFLFTDVEGSTRLWQADEEVMREAVARHDALLMRAVVEAGGTVFANTGDGVAAVFASASAAVAAALVAQRLLSDEPWATHVPIRARMGLHTGEAECRDENYFGTAVNRAARLMAVGHGGQILCSQVTAALVEDEVPLADLGEHRLRDLDRAVRVFQVGEGSFPPLRSLDVLPGNLPLLTSSFVGRGAELASVAAALRSHRLVTLTGVGGVGKTRLALQAAADATPQFPDGVWLTELAAAATPEAMSHLVAAALGVLPRPQMTMEGSIVDFLRTRRLLLVLDNCEHLLDAVADLADAVLAAAPDVRILATSREGLGITAEHVRPLRSLSVSGDDPAASDAVALFRDRARAADPDFAVEGSAAAAVVEVCRRLDGIPLAIELAAARVASMGPAEIAGHLDERFRLLTGQRGRVERHQTLRAALEWSYSLLKDAERTVFYRLGVFPASFDEAAAIAVCTGRDVDRWDVIEALASLVAKSMVGMERSEGAARYRLLETLRHYARDRLAGADGIDALRRRHAGYYGDLAERIGAHLGSAEEVEWRRRIGTEIDNFRAATGWAFASPELADVALGVRVLDGLIFECTLQPSWAIQTWAEPALERAEELGAAQRGVVLTAAAYDAWLRGQFERAERLGTRVVADWSTSMPALGIALVAAAYGTSVNGEPARGMAILDEAQQRLTAEGAPDWMACFVHLTTSWFAYGQGDHDRAKVEALQAMETARAPGLGPSVLATALATFARSGGAPPEEALACAEESMRLTEAGAGDTAYTAALQTAALARLSLGDRRGAAGDALNAVRTDAKNGNRVYVANDIFVASQVLAAAPDGSEASSILSGALLGREFALMPMFFEDTYGSLRSERVRAGTDDALSRGPLDEARQRGSVMSYDAVIEFALHELQKVAQNRARA